MHGTTIKKKYSHVTTVLIGLNMPHLNNFITFRSFSDRAFITLGVPVIHTKNAPFLLSKKTLFST
jgi:hypothetical protein